MCIRDRATAGLLVPDVVLFGFQDGRAEGKWEVVQGECYDLDSGAEFFWRRFGLLSKFFDLLFCITLSNM